ncbi:hypothetical protein FRB90_007206 [Tulasnella sp. 427]|nr:hypothetical protein FRB90_007206 [Tulasnella sp. 427]
MSICLSVASNLRCSNLSLSQAQALLILPAVDLVFCAGIFKLNWGNVKGHQWAIIVEAIVYFCLTLFDYLERAKARTGLEVATFATYDKAIGVLTMFPLFFYCAALLLLARTDVLRLTTSRPYNRLIQFSLVAVTPLILLFNELAGLLGITYQILGGRIYLGFADERAATTSSVLTGITLFFSAYFQFIIGVACIFYIFQARGRGHGGGVIPGFMCCGSGLLLGTLETLLGFGHEGFPLILTRKIFRTAARALLISGMLLGTSVDEGFALYPYSYSTKRAMTEQQRRSGNAGGLRALISNPRASTFAQLSPSATAFHNNLSSSARHQGLLGRSNSSSSSGHLLADRNLPIENIPPMRYPSPIEFKGVQEFGLGLVVNAPQSVPERKQKRRQTDGIYFSYASSSIGRKVRPGFNAFDPEDIAKLPVRANKPGDRVTIHFPDGDYTQAPVLQLRLSDLQLPSPATVAAGLRTSDGGGDAPAKRRVVPQTTRVRDVSFSEGPRGKTPRETGVRLPSRPMSARLSRRWSSFTGNLGGGSWVVLPDEHDPDDRDHQPRPAPSRADELEPPQPSFVVHDTEGRPSTPRSSRSRLSESESLWLKGATLPTPGGAGDQQQQRFSQQQRSTWNSDQWDLRSPATPNFSVVEARAVSIRGPHWSSAYIYHPPSVPSVPSTRPSSNVPFPITPSPLNQLAAQAKDKEAQFEADIQNGLTRQLYVGERRVSRIPPDDPEDDEGYVVEEEDQPSTPLGGRPRLSDRAADMEEQSRRRSPKSSSHSRSVASDELLQADERDLRRMSHRFKSLQSIEDGGATTTGGHHESVGSADEVRSLVRGFGTVVARRPTVRSNSGERESVTLEHGQTHSAGAAGLNTFQQVFGQSYTFEAQYPTIVESQGEVESGGWDPARMGRIDSGIFGRNNSL